MAPPLEYDKEPKAPDKSATTISNEDSKLLHNIVNDQQPNPDHKPANTAANTEVENKQVVNLDDGQLRALLDEAMNYKCPKDLEGKSNLFKELLEEVQQDDQQDDQASSAAARGAARARRGGGGARGRSQLLQSNSLQDLVAALAAEPAPRRHARHHTPAHPPAPVSARAIQGGSLPSGVDTSFLMGEEPAGRGAGYLATVRCVNPPPLAERRVSASDANGPQELESLHRRSKPVFPMTYTARATLEIGSGAVCSGRAVTTTTASNQVRTRHPTCGPPARIYPPAQPSGRTKSRPHQTQTKHRPRSAEEAPKKDKQTTNLKTEKMTDANQRKLMSALCARGSKVSDRTYSDWESEEDKPRGPSGCGVTPRRGPGASRRACGLREARLDLEPETELWKNDVDRWYDGVAAYQDQFYQMQRSLQHGRNQLDDKHRSTRPTSNKIQTNEKLTANTSPNINVHNIALGNRICNKPKINIINPNKVYDPIISAKQVKYVPKKKTAKPNTEASLDFHNKNDKNNRKLHRVEENLSGTEQSDIRLRKICREKVPSKTLANPRNIRSMTISKTPNVAFSEVHQSTDVKETVNTNIRNANPKNVYAPIISADQIKYVSKKKTAKPNTEASLDFQNDKNNKVHKLCSIEENLSDTEESDIRLRKIYRDRVGNVVPSVTLANPRNIRSMTISKTPNVDYSEVHQSMDVKETVDTDICNVKNTRLSDQTLKRTEQSTESCPIKSDILKVKIVETIVKDTLEYDSKDSREPLDNCKEIEMEMIKPPSIISDSEVDNEQTVDVSNTKDKDDSDSFVKFCIAQQKLFQIIESTNEEELLQPLHISDNKEAKKLYNEELFNKEAIPEEHNLEFELKELKTKDDISHQDQNEKSANVEENNNESSENANIDEVIIPLNKKSQDQDSKDQYILAELSNNAYVFLTLPKRLLTASHNKDTNIARLPVQLREGDHNTNPLPGSVEVKAIGKVTSKKKKDKVLGPNSDAKKKDALNKNALKVLLFENLKRDVSVKPGTSISGNEVGNSQYLN